MLESLASLSLSFWAWLLVTALNYAIIVLLVPRIIAQRRDPKATLAWIFFIILVPYLGLVAFMFLGTTRLRMPRRKRRIALAGAPPGLDRLASTTESKAEDSCPADPGLLELTRQLDASAATPGNRVDLQWEGPAAFQALEAAIDEATHHLHLLYYIWESDQTGVRIRDALVRAATRGVEVRLLLDDVGSWGAGTRFFRELTAAGGRMERFLPVSLLSRPFSLNHRNHRKILVADGKIGFTGGMNVGDHYAGIGLPWRDANVRVEGPSVLRLQEIFAQDWFHATGEDLAQEQYFPDVGLPGEEWVQFVASGPDEPRLHAIHSLLFAAINLAHERIWVITPYFVPDEAMCLALQAASLRGVDVRLLLPGRTDQPLVRFAARSYYDRLMAEGVKIWELPKAFLHAKLATIDTNLATVGSANLDQRSFELNFEANAFFYGARIASELETAFSEFLDQATSIDPETFAARPRYQKVVEALARILAPIL